ncbi:MAG: histidine phosphatase family protein [Actinomycetota bacterium]|nr:histidine phosphatase family protein [Actinomycetota bacterium]
MTERTSPHSTTPSPEGMLVLLRHGETEWSRTHRHTGLTDVPLTCEGEAAARRSATLLAGRHIVRVVVSPYQRAQRTAELSGLTELGVPTSSDDRLREWDYGGYEGLTTPEIREQLGHDWTVFDDGVVPGETPGETVEQVAARAAAVLADVQDDLAHGDVALVAHGHLLRVLASVHLREEPRMGAKLLLDPGAVCLLGREHGVPVIVRWNQTASG